MDRHHLGTEWYSKPCIRWTDPVIKRKIHYTVDKLSSPDTIGSSIKLPFLSVVEECQKEMFHELSQNLSPKCDKAVFR